MSEKIKRLKMKMEVQEITFNYFARPQPSDLNFYVMMMMAIQKILLSVVSKFVVGVCDGLDACEISRPEIMSQSAPVMGLTRRETYGSICKALLLNMVTTGRVEQEQTGMAWADTRIIQGQAWVDDRRTISRGQGRDNKPGARARNQNTGNLNWKTRKTLRMQTRLTILGSEWENVQGLCSVCVCV